MDLELDNDNYDHVDSGSRTMSNGNIMEPSRRVISGSTQTEDSDMVDYGAGRIARLSCRSNGTCSSSNESGSTSSSQDGGLLSNLITMVLPTRRRTEEDGQENGNLSFYYQDQRNGRCVSTQTEESAASLRGYELCCMVIQELAMENPVPSSARDEVFEALSCCICEILDKHSILFSGMVRRFEISDRRVFSSIANELFEASSDISSFKITWGRIVSLFAFAVRLTQKYKEDRDYEKLDNVILYLSDYISQHLLDFVEINGGWEGLVKQFPLPDSEDKQIKRAMLWSGLCVGLVATMYVSSFLSK